MLWHIGVTCSWSHSSPLHSWTQPLALHANEHAPDRHRWLQNSTSLVHSMWQSWHCWKQVLDEHVMVLQLESWQVWLHVAWRESPDVKPHLHGDLFLHCCKQVLETIASQISVGDALSLVKSKNSTTTTTKQNIFIPTEKLQTFNKLDLHSLKIIILNLNLQFFMINIFHLLTIPKE